jgi:hypothetical protein
MRSDNGSQLRTARNWISPDLCQNHLAKIQSHCRNRKVLSSPINHPKQKSP